MTERARTSRAVVSALLYAATAAQSVCVVAVALVSRRVLDGGGASYIAALLLLALARPALDAFVRLFGGTAVDRAAARRREQVLASVLHKDAAAYAQCHSAQVFTRLTQDVHTVEEWTLTGRVQLAGELIRLAAAVAALFYVNHTLALLALLCGAVAVPCGRALRRYLTERNLRLRRAEERLTGCTQELLTHTELLGSMRAEEESVRRFDARQSEWLRERLGLRRLSVAANGGVSTVLQLGYALLLVWGARELGRGAMTFGDFAALVQLLGVLQAPVVGLSGVPARLATVRAARTRLTELEEMPDAREGTPLPEGARVRAVVFENVTFTYEGDERPVLRDFSLRLPLDRWVCLTGISGSGKTTLYRLILGLYVPQSGSVSLETTDGARYPCSAATRTVFGYVPQTPWLLSGSVRENLRLVRPDASDAMLWTALDRAAADFVRELPEGLDTQLSEDGGGLSAGQRQRIAIARALLGGAEILLLDEITSALDRGTEAEVLETLRREYPAALTATHRTEIPERLGMERFDLEKL